MNSIPVTVFEIQNAEFAVIREENRQHNYDEYILQLSRLNRLLASERIDIGEYLIRCKDLRDEYGVLS